MECKACGKWFGTLLKEDLCPTCERDYNRVFHNISYRRLRELAEADCDGRLVVLPCKPSDVTVYQLRNKKHALGIGVSPRNISCATVWADGRYAFHHQGKDDCMDRDFGETWFLTREEAEAAMEMEDRP